MYLMRTKPSFLLFLAAIACACVPHAQAQDNGNPTAAVKPAPAAPTEEVFVAKPYVQLGPGARNFRRDTMAIVWQTPDTDAEWGLEVKSADKSNWSSMDAPVMRRIAVANIPPHRVYTATLRNLTAGYSFDYRVSKNGQIVFGATGRARMPFDAPYRFAALGDGGAGTPAQKQIAFQAYQAKPDFVVLTGDIVSERGTISEYRQNFFPVYNADKADPAVGAPLTRSTLFVAAPGSHDIANPNFDTAPDSMAYFYYWSQPQNGTIIAPAVGKTAPLVGSPAAQKAFTDAVKDNYPRMANFSFNYGNAHWTVLDSNSYVDWTKPELRDWLEKDLADSQMAIWRFVAFHHSPFDSSKEHGGEQQMRLLCDIFERNHVDVVFSAGAHNYQRTYPLAFAVKKNAAGNLQGAAQANGAVAGQWTLDKYFDGVSSTRPNGVLYLNTGGGGAALTNPEQQNKPKTWQPFTSKYIADVNSLTVVDVNGKELTFRQISAQGKELDRFTVIK